jgi:hypothetical protein
MTTTDAAIRDQARDQARQTLAQSASFHALPVAEQRQLYLDVVQENIDRLEGDGQARRRVPVARGFVESFDDYDPGFEGSVDAFEDLVDSVDFPKFVGDLLKSVFDANLRVSKQQTDDYIRLLREATKTSADFIKSIADEDAFAHLVESPAAQFGMTMERGADGSSKMVLTTPEGEPVDMEDNEVKAKIVEAKIALAREHRAALREVILMGVSRLVVEKGEVEAAVKFRITANRRSADTMSNTNTNVNTVEGSYRSPLGGIFGGPSGRFSNVNTNINVVTSQQTAEDTLFAELMGKVNIKFKSDYFELDNFAQMYGAGGVAALPPPGQQGAPPPQAVGR